MKSPKQPPKPPKQPLKYLDHCLTIFFCCQVKRMIVSTYQAASGAGAAAMEELRSQTRDVLEGKPANPQIFPFQVRGVRSRG